MASAANRSSKTLKKYKNYLVNIFNRIIGLLRDRSDMAIVLVEQYFEFARDLADSFIVMERGGVVLSGQRSDMVEEDVRRYLTV